MGLSVYDYAVIVFYLIFMFSLGPVYKGFSKTASDYFRGGGGMLWWMVGSSSFMVTFSAWSFTGGAAKAYETGTFFLLLFFCNICALIFMYFFTVAKYRQMRVITAIEAVYKRFGKVNEQVFTWLYLPTYVIFGGVWLYSISIFMSGAFGVNMEILIVVLGGVVLGMTLLGGSWAATAGDFVQMLVVLAITIMMAIIVLCHPDIGGVSGLVKQLPAHHFDWTLISRPWVLVFFTVTLLLGQIVQMNSMTIGATRYVFVKNGKDAKKAVLVSILGYLLLAPIWMIPAVAATIFHPDLASEFPGLNNPNEAAYVAMAITFLPKGMLGLLICGIFAASVTSMNSQLNVASGTFVRNFYIKIIDKNASDSRQIFVGRVFIFFYGVAWMVVALVFKSVKGLALFDLMLIVAASVGTPIAIPMFFSMFIKKTPEWSGWSTMLIGLITALSLRFVINQDSIQSLATKIFGPASPLTATELSSVNIAITTGTIILVCVSWFFLTMLFYKRNNAEYEKKVDHFFEEMNSPVDMAKEHGPEYDNDSRQSRVMGNLCMIYGGFILLLLFIPNDMQARISISLCGLFIGGLGALLRRSACKIDARKQNDIDLVGEVAIAGETDNL